MTLLELVKLREMVIAKINYLREIYAENERRIMAINNQNKEINKSALELDRKLRELNAELKTLLTPN